MTPLHRRFVNRPYGDFLCVEAIPLHPLQDHIDPSEGYISHVSRQSARYQCGKEKRRKIIKHGCTVEKGGGAYLCNVKKRCADNTQGDIRIPSFQHEKKADRKYHGYDITRKGKNKGYTVSEKKK